MRNKYLENIVLLKALIPSKFISESKNNISNTGNFLLKLIIYIRVMESLEYYLYIVL